MKGTLGQKLSLMVVILVSLVLIVQGIISTRMVREAFFHNTVIYLQGESSAMAERLLHVINETGDYLSVVRTHRSIEDHVTFSIFQEQNGMDESWAAVDMYLHKIYLSKPQLFTIDWVDARGKILLHHVKGRQVETASLSDRGDFKLAGDKKSGIAHRILQSAEKEWMLESIGILNIEGKREGAIIFYRSLSETINKLMNDLEARSISAILVDGRQQQVAQTPGLGTTLAAWMVNAASQDERRNQFSRVRVAHSIPEVGWTLILAMEPAEADHVAWQLGVIGGFSALMLVMVLYGYVRWALVNPLLRISHGVRAVIAGNLNQHLNVSTIHGGHELAELAANFNLMADRIKDNIGRLESRENYLKSILKNSLDAIISTDIHGTVIHMNPAAETLFGYQKDVLLNQNISDFIIPEESRELHCTGLQRYANLPSEQVLQLKRRIALSAQSVDGTRIEIEMSLISVENDGHLHFIAFMHDVSEQKQLLKSLEDALNMAELASRAKSEFLANMSHEIRTPMNAIIGMTDLVLGTPLSSEQIENLEMVQRASNSLLELLNGILDFSKIESGHLKLESVSFNLLDQMETACETMAIRAHKKGLELVCAMAPDLPEVVVGDPFRLTQVMINLLNNAIKFTSTGEITLSASLEPDASGQVTGEARVRFSVRDSGIGIPGEKLSQIFERFTQVDGSTTRKYGGSGLGLTISQHLIHMMGGAIQVKSEEGHGSEFYFTVCFPVGKLPDTSFNGNLARDIATFHFEKPLSGLKIWIACVNQALRTDLVQTMRHSGADGVAVTDSADLITRLEKARKDPFALAIVDHFHVEQVGLLPAGCDTHPGWQKKVLVLLPVNRRLEDLKPVHVFAKIVGIRKPPRRLQLIRLINRLAGRLPENNSADTRQSQFQVAATPLDILLVEDNPDSQRLAIHILKRCGHRVTVANNGQAGMECITKMATCDLVLMDLQMPGMNGYELTRWIRTHAPLGKRQQVPIIACTACALEIDHQNCLDAGMNGFLCKPYRSQELLDVLQPRVAHKASTTPIIPETPKNTVLSATHCDAETFARHRHDFVQDGQKHLEAVAVALDNEESGTVLKLTEALQELAVQVGAQRVKMRAIFLGRKAEMKIWQETASAFEQLRAEFTDAVTALHATAATTALQTTEPTTPQ
ncbi:MAG: ATP-binding protein [Magnetococcus sp. DMHC-1]